MTYYYKRIAFSKARNMNKTTEVYIFARGYFRLIGTQNDNSASWAGHGRAVHNIIIAYKAHRVHDANTPLHLQGMFVSKRIKLIELP